jgi:hypothetical protein
MSTPMFTAAECAIAELALVLLLGSTAGGLFGRGGLGRSVKDSCGWHGDEMDSA